MSRLPNAPLLEVIFELRWKVSNQDDLEKCRYLDGDLYSALKDTYPIRESLVPPIVPPDMLINQPVHRFRKSENDYPLFQVGPGVLTLNTNDNSYFWKEYFLWSEELINTFVDKFNPQAERFIPHLIFIDFFKFDFESDNIIEFIENLGINIKQKFHKNGKPSGFNFGYVFDDALGKVSVTVNSGMNSEKEEGLVMHTRVDGVEFAPESKSILKWLDESHVLLSDLFKTMTKGELFKSFK